MKKKLQFLFSLVALMLVATFAKAQVTIDTDLTSSFSALTVNTNWKTGAGGTAGYTATNFCPEVAVNGLGNKQVCEFYEANCNRTGDLLYQTVTGLTAGTYTIELYGGAAYTFGRGFSSTAFSEGTWNAGDKITEETGVILYAETSEGSVELEIPIYYATDFPEGAATATLKNVVVGTNGEVKIGLKKTSTSTNWHVVQLKSVVATVDANALHTTALTNARTTLNDDAYAAVTGAERTALINAIQENVSPEQTADALTAAIQALNDATTAFTAANGAYSSLAAVKASVNTEAWPYASTAKAGALAAAAAAEATSAADATAKAAALTQAYRQFIESSVDAEGVDGAEVKTSLIVNPTAAEAIAAPWNVVLGEGSGGSLSVLDGEPWTDGSGNSANKYFDGGNWGANAWDVSLVQEIALEPGKYMLSAIGRASADVALKLFAGGESVAIPAIGATGGTFDRGWNHAFVEFEVAEAGNVQIGVQGVTSVLHNWMSFSDFRLVQLPAAAPVPTTYAINIAETENGTVTTAPETEAEAGATVTVTATPAEGYETKGISVIAANGNVLTVSEENTFVMPAFAVQVSATFEKIAAPEPEPGFVATLVHTAGANWGSNVGPNTVDSEAEHYNTDAASGWAGVAFAEFSTAELPAGATITKATLTWTTITGGKANTNRDNKVYYLNAGETVDYDAILAEQAAATYTAHQYTDKKTFIYNYVGQNTFQGEVDATEAVKALVAAGQDYIIFQWTGNAASADLAGKASENAPKLVIEYLPGAPEIANASFEADGEKAASNGPLTLTGWTFEGVGNQFNNTEIRGAESESTTSQFGTSAPSDGEYSLFFRQGWNNDGNTITITSDALAALPAGDYVLSVDYKQHYSYDNSQNSNTKVGIALVNGDVTVGSEVSPAAPGVQGGTANGTYFDDTEWSTLSASFSVNEAIAAGSKVVITLYSAGQRRSDFFLDNVKLEKVPGVELALLDLQKAIDAAKAEVAKYPVGESFFQYAASEIEPLTNAITTAEGVYTAAESKEAVETATTTLNGFVETFAPVQTAPAADKQYTFQLKLDGETPLYMNLAEAGITIAEEATPLSFVATENAGQFNLVSEDELYVGLAGGNAWTMSTAADKKAAWTFTALGNGEYQINNLVTAGRFVGTNAADKAAGSPCYADKQTSNGNVTWIIAEYVAPEPELTYVDLTKEMFHDWSAADGTAEVTTENAFCEYGFSESSIAAGTTIYGNGSVLGQSFADISKYNKLVMEVTEGNSPRILLNVVGQVDPKTFVELNSGASKPYFTIEGTTWTVDLDGFKATENVEYVHLNTIKIGWGGAATVASAKLGFIPQTYSIEIAAAENGTVEAAKKAAEATLVPLTITPAEGYELASLDIKDAAGNSIEYDAWEGGFIMPSSNVTITPVFQVGYVKITDVALDTDGEFDEDGDVKVVVTYKVDAAGSFADEEGGHILDPIFTYSVFDAAGQAIVADAQKNPADINDGTFNIYIPDLDKDATYTIKITGIDVMDYATFETVFAATNVAEKEFTTPAPGTSYAGFLAERGSHPSAGNIGDKTEAQTVFVEDAVDGKTNIKFSGINYVGTTVPMPINTGAFKITGVDVTENGDGSITYSAANVTIQAGMAPYSGTLTGTQASADATPVFTLVVKNAVTLTAVFAATEAEAQAALDIETGINAIATDAAPKADGKYLENGKIVIIKGGVKYGVNGAAIK